MTAVTVWQKWKKNPWFWITICVILGGITTTIILVVGTHKRKKMLTALFREDESVVGMKDEPLDISYHSDVLSAEEAAEIIAWAKPKLRPSGLVDVRPSENPDKIRNSKNTWLPLNKFESTKRIVQNVSKLTGLPVSHFEDFQVIHYRPGQKYSEHFDPCQPKTPQCIREMDEHRSGVRRFTFFIYLNDVEGGGETHFPLAGVKVKPELGKAILWRNTVKDGSDETNLNALHAGLPPTKGEKWAMNLWIRSKRFY